MISVSVREALQAAGRFVSLWQTAQQQGKIRPLSLRWWLAAPPAGSIRTKVFSLLALQQKFEAFINEPTPPLFKVRLHGEHYGSSNADVYRRDPRNPSTLEARPFYTKDLGHLEIPLDWAPNPDYRFNDLNTERVTAQVVASQPTPAIEAFIGFETGGEELKINNFPNVDLLGFNIRVKMEFGRIANAVDLFGWIEEVDAAVANARITGGGGTTFAEVEFRGRTFRSGGTTPQQARRHLREKLAQEFIVPDANVNVFDGSALDGPAERAIEGAAFDKLFDALGEQKVRDTIRRAVTTWLVGGAFHVLNVASDSQAVTIDYILPLRQVDPFPERPQPPLDPGLLANIDHIVVLMMENRSFDHMLGYLRKHGGRSDIDGLVGGERNPYKGADYFSFPLSGTVFSPGPCHEHDCVVNQIDGGRMDRFVADYAVRAEAQGLNPGQVMGYHTATQVPAYDALAREFLICQRWFAAHPGPTFPNRFYTLTGRLNRDASGGWQFNNPEGWDFVPVFGKTIFDHLTAQGVSWRYFEDGYCFLRLFERYTGDTTNIVDVNDPANGFFARASAGQLPAVSFIDPNFVNLTDSGDNDDQPPANITAGQNLIGRVANAVIDGPLWDRTLLIITYDEHGGFFDHVPPPAAIAVSGIGHYGVRVPALIVSPRVVRGGVSDIVFDHTSIAKTIARRFLSTRPPDMGERMAAANDLSMVLRPTARQDRPNIPVPLVPAPTSAIDRRAVSATEGPRDSKSVLRSMRARYPVVREAVRLTDKVDES